MDTLNDTGKPGKSKGTLEIARRYIRRGWAVIPIMRGEKAPREPGWPTWIITEENVGQHFNSGLKNIGVQLGPKSNGLTDVDLDCAEARALAPHFLPSTGAVFGRPSSPRSHWLYVVTEPPGKSVIKYLAAKDDTLVELRLGTTGKGVQTVFPGSQHPCGELIEWDRDGEPASVPSSSLENAIRKIAVGAILIRCWPNGARHQAALCLAGLLVRAGWNEGSIVEFVGLVAHEAHDEEVEDREQAARDTVAAHARGEPVSGLPKLGECIGEEAAKVVAKILGYREADTDIDLERMNEQFCVLKIGNKARVLTFEKEPRKAANIREVASFLTFADFRNLQDHIKVDSRKKLGRGTAWLNNPLRRQYAGLVFLPGEGREVAGYLNLWRGFKFEPREGDWSLMRAHIENVLAKGVHDDAQYILKWCAYAVQHPGEQTEVVLVFRGGRGTGRGIFGRTMCEIFGQHGLQISSADHLTGKFNAHLMDVAMLFADEAFWPGAKSAEGTLKRMITEPTLTIEKKGVDSIDVENYLKIIIASNEEWVVPAGLDERRFAVFVVSEEHKQEKDYFIQLYAELNNGGKAAMLYDLLHMDIGDWHPRYDVPQTAALQDQKRLSLNPYDQWWLGLLIEGMLPNDEVYTRADKRTPPDRTSSEALFAHARRTVPALKNASDHLLGRALKERGCERGRMRDTRRGWKFPELSKARADWMKRTGIENEWWGEKDEWIPRPFDAPEQAALDRFPV
jgi:hypothetical protein